MTVGRNDPCPCNSGKKYKQCCMRQDEAKASSQLANTGAINTLLQQAAAHFEAGRLPQSEAACQQLLQLSPNHPDALHLLGIIALQVGKYPIAVDLIGKAISLSRNRSPFMHFNLGAAWQGLGNLEQAIAQYRKVVELMPEMATAHNNLGQAYRELQRFDEAVASCREAIRLQPDLMMAHANLGMALKEQGRYAEAEASYGRALALCPDSVDTLSNLGVAQQQQGKIAEAEATYRRVIALKPDHIDALSNLSVILQQSGLVEEAVALCRRALQYQPDAANVLGNMAAALLVLGHFEEAATAARRAITASPGLLMAHNNLGSALRDQGLLEEAVASYRHALALSPGFADAHTNLLLAMQYMAGLDPAEVFRQHRRFAEQFEAPLKPHWIAHDNRRDPEKRIRVGYVSPDFRNHAVAYFIEPILAHHDRSQVEVYCYYTCGAQDGTTARIKSLADCWVACAGLSDDELATRIRHDGIEILVDLSGHTALNRLLTFARRPAPVQATWIGFPGTTGLEAMDYRLTDGFLDPEGLAEPYHTETLQRLSSSATFLPAADSPPVNALPALASGEVTLACLNNLVKINRHVIAVWARILAAKPASRLMLGNIADAATEARVLQQFAAAGVPAERLLLVPKMSLPDYLALHHRIDLGLDPFPYGGGTTTNHSLWMGVPVVTLTGATTASRQGAAILAGAGMPEFITGSEDEYIARVLELMDDLPRLDAIRQSLRDRLLGSKRASAAELTRSLEQAYRQMWQRWCSRQDNRTGQIQE
jgi:predicted O-linked N-acetylglucosamine transferase (SPINDLY family)